MVFGAAERDTTLYLRRTSSGRHMPPEDRGGWSVYGPELESWSYVRSTTPVGAFSRAYASRSAGRSMLDIQHRDYPYRHHNQAKFCAETKPPQMPANHVQLLCNWFLLKGNRGFGVCKGFVGAGLLPDHVLAYQLPVKCLSGSFQPAFSYFSAGPGSPRSFCESHQVQPMAATQNRMLTR